MFDYLYNIIIIPGSILLPIIIALINYKFLDKSLKIILIFNIISATFNFTNVILGQHGIHTLFLFHFYAIFEFACISWFYRQQLTGNIKNVIPILVGIFTIICLVNFFFIQTASNLNTYTRSLESVIIIGYSVMFFNRQSLSEARYQWGSLGVNWANAALLIFYSCGFFTFMILNYVVNANKEITDLIWTLYDTAILVENILFAIGFYKSRRQPIILPSSV